MTTTTRLSKDERAAIRLRFFSEFRGPDGCTSATVRRDRETHEWYLAAGYAGTGSRLDMTTFQGLSVRTFPTSTARHAVQYIN